VARRIAQLHTKHGASENCGDDAVEFDGLFLGLALLRLRRARWGSETLRRAAPLGRAAAGWTAIGAAARWAFAFGRRHN
jgi:hypothetical protein